MHAPQLASSILRFLPYDPNEQQAQVVAALARFCCADMISGADRVFVLNGYAGTGKTSLTGALVKALAAENVNTVLLAPTGRAAKVFGAYAGRHASTIHRAIYSHALPGVSYGGGHPPLRDNRLRDTVFIVDEASMIADEEGRETLLSDLIQFVYGAFNCRLILLGDTAQLPPVGSDISPAMDPDTLRSMSLKVNRAVLTEVARQGAFSGILANATRLRRAQAAPPDTLKCIPLRVDGFDDVQIAYPDDLPDLLQSSYSEFGPEETIIITRSNRSATDFNQAVRTIVLDREELLTPGDLMIAAKNNYFWTRRVKGIDFVANGEILRLSAVHGTEIRYGLLFADVTFELPDEPEVSFDAKIVTESLLGTSAALDYDSLNRLYEGAYSDPEFVPAGAPHEERIKLMRQSPYFNALQMKYAYAVTCHKAQGGQWRHVYVDLGGVPPESTQLEYLRWLYTAVTRARTRLYLINPPEQIVV